MSTKTTTKITLILFIFMISATASCNNKKKIEIVNLGKNLSSEASIVRNKETKEAYLKIRLNTDWELYAGTSVEEINTDISIARGDRSGEYKLDINTSYRNYFLLVTNEGQMILSDCHLPMSGGYNFRDMGGIVNKDGKYVKWGKVLRSDDLYNLTDGDLKYLGSIPLKTIVDFRSKQEIEEAPDRVPTSVTNTPLLSLAPGNLLSTDMRSKKSTREDIENMMKLLNQLLVSDPECVAQYKTFFELLQDESQTPLMFHCSAGKDRTGMGAALFLASLNVSEDVIVGNYLESNFYLANKYASWLEQDPATEPMLIVKPEYIQAGLDVIKEKYGSTDRYLTQVLNVDLNKMKSLYLY